MSTYHEAADSIRRAAKQYEVFVKTAEILDRTGSFENAAKEAEAACLASIKARDAARAELVQAKDDLAKAKDEAKKLADESIAKQADLMAEAKTAAEAEAAVIMGRAKTEADKLLNAAKRREADLAAENGKQGAALVSTLAQLHELDEQIASKSQQLATLNAAIESIKAKL